MIIRRYRSHRATAAFLVVAASWSSAGILTAQTPSPEPAKTAVIVAVGAAGEDRYTDTFVKWTTHWKRAVAASDGDLITVGVDAAETAPLEKLRVAVEAQARETASPLWLVFLGHGSFDGREGKFNLRGDDLTASELAKWLAPFHRPLVVVCGFSASGAFLKPLSAPDRVIVTATKSGAENNFARFGGYFSEAIDDSAADLDKDGQTSVLEAWISAAQKGTVFYESEQRLATEHSLLDDNGDGLGTPADWFAGVRLVKKSTDQRAPDGLRAHQLHLVPSAAERALPPPLRAERDRVEREVAALRESKASVPEDEYFRKLEELLLILARLYHEVAAPRGS